ncbi:MAG: ribosome biogenesis GTPase Der [Spirochaetota bacterium]
MKELPVVSIVGRQNVGKSTLFNTIIKQRKAIVDKHPGLTRDVVSYMLQYHDVSFIINDTPGLDLEPEATLSKDIKQVSFHHLQSTDVFVLLFEKPDIASYDYELIELVRKFNKPYIIAINKIDHKEDMECLPNFYELGQEFIPISALHKRNIDLLLNTIVSNIPHKKQKTVEIDCKIALVGRPNSGKSTLLNAFLGYQRAIVSEIPGTTRDSIDETFKFHGKTIMIIDTAGIRRESRIDNTIEYYAVVRSKEAIDKADIIVHLIDATSGITETDKKIADIIMQSHKPSVLAINKWDCIEKDHTTFDIYKDRIIFKYYRATDFPIISISALQKLRIHKLLQTALEINTRAKQKVETSKINIILENVQKRHAMPLLGGELKIYYATQTSLSPPVIRLFVNKPELFRKDVARFLEKTLQQALNWHGIPIVFEVSGRK